MSGNTNSDEDTLELNNHDKFQQTQNQIENIAEEIRQKQPLTSQLMPVVDLKKNYEASTNFEKGVLLLAQDYIGVRTIRGDGNCYYRAFLYSLCESLFKAEKEEKDRLRTFAESSMDKCTKSGYETATIEMFHESLVELISSIVDRSATPQKIHEELVEENGTSDYCTWYMRVLTATQLKSDPERFLPFVEDGSLDIFTFCQKSVEPMYVECSMVQVLALAEIFEVQVKIEYLDGRDITNGKKLAQLEFGPENAMTSLTLLYRPGHYDILYPKEG